MPTPKNKTIEPRVALIAGGASIFTAAFLIAIKLLAYWENGSASLLASLIDSVVDASVSLMTFLAVRLSLKPADSEHRHGHGKVEGLAALFQAAFIAGAGLFLLLESISRFQHPLPAVDHADAMIIMAISAVMSAFLVTFQSYSLARAPSLAIEADRAHFSMDIIINLAVIAVLFGLQKGLPTWIDPAFAILIVAYLALTARKITGKGVDMLLDRELSGDVRETIIKKVLLNPKVLGIHDLRTSKSGMRLFISFDIELDPNLVLRDAHEIVRDIEHALLAEFPAAEILIHADPFGDTFDTRHPQTENV